jgi:predicted phosphoadenosine phosphosulfate sulfurtransferase
MARTVVRGVVDVLEAVNKRISFLFDNMIISIGFLAGKDSTVLFHLINEEAKKRDRKFILYFQDQSRISRNC